MKTTAAMCPVRDRDGGAFCFAHVIRRHPVGTSSFSTSLRRTPHPPDRVTPSQLDGRKAQACPPKPLVTKVFHPSHVRAAPGGN